MVTLDGIAHYRWTFVKKRTGISVALAVLMVLPIGCASGQTPRVVAAEGDLVTVELVREHKNAIITQVSPDSKSMMLWQTDTPIQTVRIPGGDQDSLPTAGDSKLLWVEVETGKELASIPVGFLPRVRFFPKGDRVVVKHNGDFADFQTIIWDLAGNRVNTCLEDSLGILDATPISDDKMVALR
jgi:hypothetical protein